MDKSDSKSIDKAISEAFFKAMEELKAVIEGENEVLARGLPNTILELKARKAALQAQCTALLLEVSDDVQALALDQALLDQLAMVTQDMRRLTDENSKLVKEATQATRRRVDAVMAAIQMAAGDEDDSLDALMKRSSSGRHKGDVKD